MADACCCANGSCKNAVDAEVEYHTCSLCRSPIYCSDECRVIDWPLHNCPNVQHVQGALKPMLEPYYYQDMVSAVDAETLAISDPAFQSRAYLFTHENRNVAYYTTTLVEGIAVSENGRMPMVRGAKPPTTMLMDEYQLAILVDGQNYSVRGVIPHDMIYAENQGNPKAKAIAGFGATFGEKVQGLRRRLYAKEGSYIFWPGPDNVAKAKIPALPLDGDITVDLQLSHNKQWTTVANVHAGYELYAKGDGFWKNAGRATKKVFTQSLQLKFGKDVDVKQLQVLSYADTKGNGVLLTFSVDNRSARLVDIEYMTPKLEADKVTIESESAFAVEDRFICNARDLNDVVGLAMALETHLALRPLLGQEVDKQLERYCGIIKNHAYDLQEAHGASGAQPSPQVSVAIAAAMDALYTDIGASAALWKKRVDGSVSTFQQQVEAVISKMAAVRAKSNAAIGKTGVINKVKNTAWSVQKGALQRELQRIETAINNKMGSLSAQGLETSTVYTQLQSLLSKVQQARQS